MNDIYELKYEYKFAACTQFLRTQKKLRFLKLTHKKGKLNN
jgi:hypothetical protein